MKRTIEYARLDVVESSNDDDDVLSEEVDDDNLSEENDNVDDSDDLSDDQDSVVDDDDEEDDEEEDEEEDDSDDDEEDDGEDDEDSEEDDEREQSTSNKIFVCDWPDCTNSYGRKDHLKAHIRVHKGEWYYCDFPGCTRKYTNCGSLSHHRKTHLPKVPKVRKVLKCPCTHPGCDRSFKNAKELSDHRIMHTDDHIFCPAENCTEKYKSYSGLRYHYERKHSKVPPYQCSQDGCEFRAWSPDSVNLHAKSHEASTPKPPREPEGVFPCPHCGTVYPYAKTLHDHMRKDHVQPNGEYLCQIDGCGKWFSTYFKFTRHTKKHCIRNIPCSYPNCRETFETEKAMTNHERSHYCIHPGCNFSTASHGTLSRHRRKHTNPPKKFVCPEVECGASFHEQNQLDSHHMVKHTDEKPFVCTVPGCDKAYNNHGSLFRHVQTHTDVRPHACTHEGCEWAFREKRALEQHLRTHTGEKPFQCRVCGKAFAQTATLLTHCGTHLANKPFKCAFPFCGYQTHRKLRLDAHFQAWHSPEANMRRKLAENRVALFLRANGIAFEPGPHISFNCIESANHRSAVLDFVVYTDRTIFIIEVDEHQHDGNPFYTVSCELARMLFVQASILCGPGERPIQPIVWLRYNPDACRVNDSLRLVKKVDREARLLNIIQTYKPTKDMSVIYMYYNCYSVTSQQGEKAYVPCILDDEDYLDSFKVFVEAPVL